MRTALDTNVLSAIWTGESRAATIAARLGWASGEGILVISPVVYAELLAHPTVTEDAVNAFLKETSIEVDLRLDDQVWIEAGRRFGSYAQRRRTSGDRGEPRRLLADFVVGAHALLQADRLMTLDKRRFEYDFPELAMVAMRG